MELGNKIRQLRYKTSMTQEQLAERLGVSSQAVSKWENSAAMPDISLLPDIAEVFGVTIDDLFDLTREQKFNRIESRMENEDELEPDVFREYEDFLKEQAEVKERALRAKELLAGLYHHRLEAWAAKTGAIAREVIALAPERKDSQWYLTKAEGGAIWDWNFANHCKTIDFYKQIVENDPSEPKTPMPYYYLIDNLLADRRAKEAAYYLERVKALPAVNPILVPTYEAAIALAEFDEKRADAIIEKALEDNPSNSGMMFEAAQYFARKCDYDRAIELFEASYAAEENKKPRFTDALESISMIYEIRGEYKKAAEAKKRELKNLKEEWGMTEEVMVRETEREIERLLKK